MARNLPPPFIIAPILLLQVAGSFNPTNDSAWRQVLAPIGFGRKEDGGMAARRVGIIGGLQKGKVVTPVCTTLYGREEQRRSRFGGVCVCVCVSNEKVAKTV